jgi:hypothetical protein
VPNNGCSESGNRTSWESGVGGATKWQHIASAAYNCCAPKRDAAKVSAAAYRLGVVHCNGRDRCATAPLPSTQSTKTKERRGARQCQLLSRQLSNFTHNKNPQPRAATKPNCEKMQSHAARCCPEQGCVPFAGLGPGVRWWERLGCLPARYEHQYVPGASQKIGGQLSFHNSEFITHMEPDAKAEKRRYMTAARNITPPPNQGVG